MRCFLFLLRGSFTIYSVFVFSCPASWLRPTSSVKRWRSRTVHRTHVHRTRSAPASYSWHFAVNYSACCMPVLSVHFGTVVTAKSACSRTSFRCIERHPNIRLNRDNKHIVLPVSLAPTRTHAFGTRWVRSVLLIRCPPIHHAGAFASRHQRIADRVDAKPLLLTGASCMCGMWDNPRYRHRGVWAGDSKHDLMGLCHRRAANLGDMRYTLSE